MALRNRFVAAAFLGLLGSLHTVQGYSTDGDFEFLAVYYTRLNEPDEIEIQMMPNIEIGAGEKITVYMPGFSTMDRPSIIQDYVRPETYFELYKTQYQFGDSTFMHTMTTIFDAQWTEGKLDESNFPEGYMNSTLELRVKTGRVLTPKTLYKVTIYKETGVQPLCGTAQLTGKPDEYFQWNFIRFTTNAAASTGSSQKVMYTNQVGQACHDREDCNGHGYCEYCRGHCVCDEGYGNPTDLTQVGAQQSFNKANLDCSERICPKGIANYLPSSATSATEVHECSNQGMCDRSSGECKCFSGFEGAACEKRKCPSGCSGHGRCLPIRELAQTPEALPLASATSEYGSHADTLELAWDHDVLQGCVCDSSWEVGLGDGQVQDPEWFGPDCSLRRCPSGDDPLTKSIDETDCSGKTARGGRGVGATGNRCHLDCSGRGLCDHKTGLCACFAGFSGDNCGTVLEFTRK